MVGAFARLPAREEMPTNRNEPTVPITAAIVACQNEIPKPKKNEPYDNAKKEIYKASRKEIEEVSLKIFENFIRKL